MFIKGAMFYFVKYCNLEIMILDAFFSVLKNVFYKPMRMFVNCNISFLKYYD